MTKKKTDASSCLLQASHVRSGVSGKQILPGPIGQGGRVWGQSLRGALAVAGGHAQSWCVLWAVVNLPVQEGLAAGCLLWSVIISALGQLHILLPLVAMCSAGLAKSSLSSKYSYSNNKSVFIISPLVSKLQLWYLHSIYLNFIGVFSWEIGFHFHS